MLKIYFLSTCDTCKKIIKLFHPLSGFEFQDLKTQPLTEEQLSALVSAAGSYANLVNRKAQKIKALGLQIDQLSEPQIKNWLLQEYTFLKRPVIVIDHQYFIGNQPAVIDKALAAWQQYQLQRT